MAAKRPSYKQLWGKYQEFRSDPHPIEGVSAQCAVRMSMTLAVVGLYSTSRFRSVIPKGATVEGWAIRAEELYQYLRNETVLGSAEKVPPSALWGKWGIIYLRDCWARSGQSDKNRSGDHFDLVFPNGGEMGGYPAIASALFYRGDVSNSIIDFCRDGKVRFWECPL